ncbi:hypothetical protein ACHQM5_029749 [Ranunculus cassubicifolius]
MATTGLSSLTIKSYSFDTQPRGTPSLPPTLHSPSFNHFKKKILSIPKTPKTIPQPQFKKESINVSNLLQLNTPIISQQEETEELYLGSERWLPSPPKVNKPRSTYNAASLAYIGDCIYELYARRHFLYPPLSIEQFNDRVMAVVRCEAQDALLKKLLREDFLSVEERDILRWGRNIDSAKTRTTKRAGVAVYNRASSLETLIGYLYLTNPQRLEDVMVKLGFTTAASDQLIMEKSSKNKQKSKLSPENN